MAELEQKHVDAAPDEDGTNWPASSRSLDTCGASPPPLQPIRLPEELRGDSARRASKWPLFVVSVFCAIALLAAWTAERGVFHEVLGKIYGKRAGNSAADQSTMTSEPGARPASSNSPLESATTSPATAAAPPDVSRFMVSLDRPGLVLQVSAMTHEENADALVAVLQHKSFPAFEFRRGSDRFYRVVVGPYPDMDSTVKVEKELERQGFQTFARRWTPE